MPPASSGVLGDACDDTALLEDLLVWEKGPFALDKLAVRVAEGRREFPEDVTVAANHHWATLVREKPQLFDGPVWSLLSREVRGPPEERELQVCLQQSSYKFVVFTHLSDAGRQLPQEARCNACGLMALLHTAEGAIVFGRRSRQLGAMPGYWHCVPAGNVDAPDPLFVLEQELVEETGLCWSEVRGGELFALLSAGEEQGHKAEFIFRLSVKATASEVYRRYRSNCEASEHEALVFVCPPDVEISDDDPETAPPKVAMEDFVAGALGPLTDVSRRALLLLGALGSLPPPALGEVPRHLVGQGV